VVAERKSIINDAHRDAAVITRKAEERAKLMVANQEIVRLAQSRAEEIMLGAQQKSKELRHTTNDYIDNMLSKSEEQLNRSLSDVKKVRIALRNSTK
jgi:vacuolar-type H+-ATPase subunit H